MSHISKKEGFIEFEELYSQEETTLLHSLLEKTLANLITPSDDKLLFGYDLQRETPPLLQALHFSRLAQIASPLFQQKRLRVAFTQYLPCYKTEATIQEISSFSEILGAVFINLGAPANPEIPYLPQSQGSGCFISGELPIDFSKLNAPLLLIVFAGERARYHYQEKDPHIHKLKKLGYAFGERITVETHPLFTKDFLH